MAWSPDDVDEAVFDVVRIYRNNDNVKVRQLALNTLHKMQNNWAMDFLGRSIKFEKSPVIKKQLYCILQEYQTRLANSNQEKEDIVLAQKN